MSTHPGSPAAARRAAAGLQLPSWFKLGVSVAIAAISVAAALMVLVAGRMKDDAGSLDKRSVLQTAELQTLRIQIESEVRLNQREFARYLAEIAEAQGLEAAAVGARARGEEREAVALQSQAKRLRSALETLNLFNVLGRGGTLSAYVETTPAGERFDEARRREDLVRLFEVSRKGDPSETAAAAERVRDRSLGLAARLVALAVALSLLTISRVVADAGSPAGALSLAGSGVLLFLLVLGSIAILPRG